MSTLGQQIRKARIDRRWTQQDLLRATGLSQRYLSAVELDKVDPRLSVVRRIARALGVPIEYLVDLNEPEEEEEAYAA